MRILERKGATKEKRHPCGSLAGTKRAFSALASARGLAGVEQACSLELAWCAALADRW